MSDMETRFRSLQLEDAIVTRVIADKSTITSADRVEIELNTLTEEGWRPMNVSFVEPLTCTIEWSATDWSSANDDISDYSCERVVLTESFDESSAGERGGEAWYRFTLDVFGRMRRISVVARDFFLKMDLREAKTE